MESNCNKYPSSEKYKRILDGLFEILSEINHILIINTNEIFLDDILNKLKKDPLIIDTIKLLKLTNFDLSKVSYSNEFFEDIENHNKNISSKNQTEVTNNNSIHINISNLNNISENNNNNTNNKEHEYINIKSNTYCVLAKKLERILNEIQLISNNYSEKAKEIMEKEALEKQEQKKIKIPKIPKNEKEKKQKMKNKKSYEVDVLSKYMIDIFSENGIKNVIEMGCGKSYLTNNILINDDMVYFGIDKKDHLIEKSELKSKKNIFLINEIVHYENFDGIYQEQIKGKLISNSVVEETNKNNNNNFININNDKANGNIETYNDNNQNLKNENSFTETKNNQNNNSNNKNKIVYNLINNLENNKKNTRNKIMLFGLHSCGNLTSDSIKIFVKNSVLTHLVIVGCCLNLLVEYVSPEVKSCIFFKEYFASIGYDNKGTFLENTLSSDWDFRKIGYPLCEYITTRYKHVFLGRPLRNIAMQNIPKTEDNLINARKNFKYKNLLFRTMLQKFFEDFLLELKFIYGYGKLQLALNDSFSLYIKNCLLRIEKMIDESDLKIKEVDNALLKMKVVDLRRRIKFIPEENVFKVNNNNEIKNFNCSNKNNNEDKIEDKMIKENEKNNFVVNESESDFIKDEDKINIESFHEKFLEYENVLWSFYAIRIKFAKIIEYIIALDRIIFLKENNVENVELVKIFDDNKSARNLLIYASKIE